MRVRRNRVRQWIIILTLIQGCKTLFNTFRGTIAEIERQRKQAIAVVQICSRYKVHLRKYKRLDMKPMNIRIGKLPMTHIEAKHRCLMRSAMTSVVMTCYEHRVKRS